jgi:sigma-B regulation protein RsbU (phosphoserine phosphatase)
MFQDAQRARSRVPVQVGPPFRGAPLPAAFARFWQRVSEGMNLGQLWEQIRADARSTYRLYSREIEARRLPGAASPRNFFAIAKQFFWAILDKLTPARRVLLLIALAFLAIPEARTANPSGEGHFEFQIETRLTGGLLLLGLLLLELTDRVAMKRDLEIAKEIQAWLLPPRPPEIPGVQIAFATRPANTLAGDYYDIFPRRCVDGEGRETGGSFLLAVTDVAGKSVPAAMLMATIQASLRTLCTTPGALPDLAARMNRYACSNSQNGRRFTTAFLAEYDPPSRTLTYVNAGHDPPLVLRSSGKFETLEKGGLPLGVMASATYEGGIIQLECGDLLAAYTDGVLEAENAASQEYGEERFRAVLRANALAPPDHILSHVLFDIHRFAGAAPQHDDVTLLLLKVV